MDMSSMSSSAADATTTTASTMGTMMSMTFHSNTTDSLWFSGWTPKSGVAYAFTIVALVAFGIMYRALNAYAATRERRVRVTNLEKANVVVQSMGANVPDHVRESQVDSTTILKEPTAIRSNTTTSISSSRLTSDNVRLINPWRLSVDLPRGMIHVVIAGTGYLLMLAVMTFNVGYFFAVLGGLFIGEVTFGRYAFAPVIAPALVENS
ncbi:putative Ctr copper transporter [Taphrina deformans PYCC 5710]|uniref:Copper transport protein n=1 Tax=Taphrina deformans (strain PYCC 5710 / ATCC 11124 / CBS 356.35 / IMI 108563 / JCM 9778 / NBRC 8474) TaxID=1097556 RepID=R4X765_TAPDE|nr:putative Ctr copper transporter [Taphrina deformans PYCC 5710]|eukprot:CCG81137.1 putative Ctr copper transporter [Taphrina deformans PYCC 5710]